MSNVIHKRLENRILEAISTMIVRGDIKDHQLDHLISISKVSLSRDKAYATVWISSFGDIEKLHKSASALQSAAGYIQRRLASILKIRNTPILTFKIDKSLREAERVERLLESIKPSDES